MPKPKFKPPRINQKRYDSLDTADFMDLCEIVAKDNKDWMKHVMPDPNLSWVLVIGNRPVQFGYSNLVPTVLQVHERCRKGQQGYVLFRHNETYCDLTLYFQTAQAGLVSKLLSRNPQDIKPYLEPVEGISFVNAQSGVLNKLEEAFAVGRMRYECPLTGSGKDQRHAQGAYSATIYHKDFNAPIRMTSQSQIEVNLRGSKTLDQKEPGRWLRIDRLHRFDDPVVDMFDTYGLKVVENVLPLILYKTRDK